MTRPRPHTQKEIHQRREEVLMRLTKGMRNKEIARELGVNSGTVTRDIQYLQKRSNDYVSEMVKGTMPFLFEKALGGINEVLGESWKIYNSSDGNLNWFHRLAALRLAKECSEEIYTLTKDGPFVMGARKIEIEFEKIKKEHALSMIETQKIPQISNQRLAESN